MDRVVELRIGADGHTIKETRFGSFHSLPTFTFTRQLEKIVGRVNKHLVARSYSPRKIPKNSHVVVYKEDNFLLAELHIERIPRRKFIRGRGIAKRNPRDTFDIIAGVGLVISRMLYDWQYS